MYKFIINFLFKKDLNIMTNLHRWCHPGIYGCTNDVISKKIDFANYDNSFGIRN